MRDGTVPHGPACSPTSGSSVVVADVAAALAEAAPASYDLVLLDVDNGPGYLVHDANAALYERRSSTPCATALRPGGALVVWSAAAAPGAARPAGGGVRRRRRQRRTTSACRAATSSTGSTSPRRVTADRLRRVASQGMDATASSTTAWARSRCPRDALWRAQTQRAVENFPISGTPSRPSTSRRIAQVKAAAAKVNAELGVITAEQAEGDPRRRRGGGRRRAPRRSSRSTSSRPARARRRT